LQGQKYSLQGNRKTKEGSSHPDRNAQFEYINERVQEFLRQGRPAISVDTKKKEQVGDFKNGGREWRPKGLPELVQAHDFGKEKDSPYGVYDLGQDTGWVNVGADHDTAAFAVESIRCWWNTMGRVSYPKASQLLITDDGGGSNGSRVQLWKLELQKLADETRLQISVCHFPPGASKWNKIEHRLFSFITQNWRGRPLVSHEVIVNLIAATTTKTGLSASAGSANLASPKSSTFARPSSLIMMLYLPHMAKCMAAPEPARPARRAGNRIRVTAQPAVGQDRILPYDAHPRLDLFARTRDFRTYSGAWDWINESGLAAFSARTKPLSRPDSRDQARCRGTNLNLSIPRSLG
jgi:hypothetical protein